MSGVSPVQADHGEKIETLEALKKRAFIAALARNKGSRVQTARDLGICLKSVRNLIEAYNLVHLFPPSHCPMPLHRLKGMK